MPRSDGTGPFGSGPLGRGMGPCGDGQGGWGRGRGFFRGGYGWGIGRPSTFQPETKEEMEQRKTWLENQLEMIRQQTQDPNNK